MTKSLRLFTQSGLLLIVIIFILTIQLSRAVSADNMLMADDDDDDTDVQEQRRAMDLRRLRNYLLTSNAEERASKREQQEFHKRELVNKLSFHKKTLLDFVVFRFMNTFNLFLTQILIDFKKLKVSDKIILTYLSFSYGTSHIKCTLTHLTYFII
jgi:hypothetical protein